MTEIERREGRREGERKRREIKAEEHREKPPKYILRVKDAVNTQ